MALALRQLTTAFIWLVFVHFHIPVSEAQQALTLSIDCGGTETYTDNTTGITWVPDNAYITTGLSSKVTSRNNKSRQFQTLRYFSGKQSKFCYELPAINGTTYLVRTGFYNGGMNTSFQLHIDTSNIALVMSDNSSDWESVVEVVTVATSKQIDVCLARTTTLSSDSPFVNSIELRQLAPKMYPRVLEGYMMITSFRYNFGGDQSILRYPSDSYDRLWGQYPSAANDTSGATRLNSSQNVVVENAYARDNAPLAVMNTAMTWPNDTIFTLPVNVSGGRNYVVLLWFAEIEDATSGLREFEVGIDENWQTPINILNVTGGKKFEAYEWGYANAALSGSSSIGFKATATSHLGPILNAMEVYEVSDPVQPRTAVRDVAAINAIKSQFWPILKNWTGDPCLYLPYDWTSCSVDTTPRITKLKLAGYNLTGSIPVASIARLTELTVLTLSNNSLNGSIPNFRTLSNNSLNGSIPNLSGLQNLQQLNLQNNNLTGEFPAWVVNLTNLQVLSVEGNKLTGYVPQSLLNNASLKFTYTPAGLCTGSSSTAPCIALPEPASPVAPPAAAPVASTSSSNSRMAILIGCVAAAGVIILTGIVLFLCCKPKLGSSISSRQLLKGDPEAAAFACSEKCQMMAYSFNEVKDVTSNFKHQIADGSYGPVYRGKMSDGREVAVKRCRPSNRVAFTEFFDEVGVLSRVYHKNLTALVGFCQDEKEQILIYEYLLNSDLQTHLHGDGKHLPWSTRLAIAIDVARGILYLHSSCYPTIIHRDVKPSNILLTKKMEAKVADFGFAKFTSENDSILQIYSTDVKGCAGYLDPEYAVSGHLTEKSDVYGFGVVLLELVSGQEPIVKPTSDRDPLLIEWMRPLLASGDIKAVVDPRLGENYSLECMWKVAELGMTCVEPRAFNRPTMTEVVEELQDAFAIEETQARGHAPLFPPGSASSSGPL